jgi:hypothetical protein
MFSIKMRSIQWWILLIFWIKTSVIKLYKKLMVIINNFYINNLQNKMNNFNSNYS